jgi:hypothetical protein
MGEALDKLVALSRFGRDGDGDGILNEGKKKPGSRAAYEAEHWKGVREARAKRAAMDKAKASPGKYKKSGDSPLFDELSKPKAGGALDNLYKNGMYDSKGGDDFGREHMSLMDDRELDEAIAERQKLNSVKQFGVSGALELKMMKAEKERRKKESTYDPETDKNFKFTDDELSYLDYNEDEYPTFASMVNYAKSMRVYNERKARKAALKK